MTFRITLTFIIGSLFLMGIAAINVRSQNVNTEETFPLIIQYIDQYKIKVNDVKDVINNQFSSITIGKVKTSYAQIKNSSFRIFYRNGSTATYLSPTKVSVVNQSYSISFTFNITVNHTLGHSDYNCTYNTENIFVNYTKEIDLVSGKGVIQAFKTSFNNAIFNKMPNCVKSPSTNDTKRIKQALSNTQSSSVYLELSKILSKMPARMQENIKSQHLSHIFQDNPYTYNYYDYNLDINVTTLGIEPYQTYGVVNQIQGTTPGSTHSSSSVPQLQQGFNLYFAKQFVQNVLDYSLVHFQKWKNIVANRTNMRTRSFRFRLIDYEEIVPSILKAYPDSYLKDTQVICNVLSYNNLIFNSSSQSLSVEFKWSCRVSVEVSPGSIYTFMDFQPTILYNVTIEARSSSYLTVYQKAISIKDIVFNIIDEHIIKEPQLINLSIEQGLFQFQTYTIGTFFKINENSSKTKIIQSGFWVG